MRERYNVQLNAVAGCYAPPRLIKYVDGYNQVSQSYIRRKYDKDIFEECAKDVQQNYDEKLKTNNEMQATP